jgi:hypothetical protein
MTSKLFMQQSLSLLVSNGAASRIYLISKQPGNYDDWGLSLIDKHEEATKSGGTRLPDIELLFPIIQGIYQRELYQRF